MPSQEINRNNIRIRALLFIFFIFLAVMAVAAWVITSAIGKNQQNDIKTMASNSGHFLDENALPELSKESVECRIAEAYYTNDDNLLLKLKLSDGSDYPQHLQTLDITLKNEKDETIAVAGTDVIDKSFVIPAGGYAELIFYIPPEYILIDNDDLDTLAYTIQAVGSAA